MTGSRADIIAGLKTEILSLQGFTSANNNGVDLGLGTLKEAFPNQCFPIGAVHEFLSPNAEDKAATSGFLAGLLSILMGTNGVVVWISACRTLFPPALKYFGVQPDRCVFVDLKDEKQVRWATEETLKCNAVTAVVAEIKNISFTESRRLQLAVEKSKVTGFIVRHSSKLNATACVSRWKITSLPAEVMDDLPGVGFPKWRVELLRIRNGRPGVWNVKWMRGGFHIAELKPERSTLSKELFLSEDQNQTRKTG